MSIHENPTLLRKGDEVKEDEEELQLAALHLGKEVYGVDIACIHTVITMQSITPVPKSPPYVKGVINLRGRVVPVIDLRDRFDMPELVEEKERGKRIVIVEIDGILAGLIVDAVSEVVRIPLSCVEATSRLVVSDETRCITGIGRITIGRRAGDVNKRNSTGGKDSESVEDRLILLLDVATAVTGASDPAIAAESLKGLQKAA